LSGEKTAGVKWSEDYEGSLNAARQNNKLLLVDFGAEWCVFCRKMDQTTFIEPDVVSRLNADFIPVKLDASSKAAKTLAGKFSIQGLPTILVLDKDGKLKRRITGFVAPDRFLQLIAEVD